ncbi:hypothetical protein ACQB60_12050 [Actinomycetota bacterium Odt1-20B]
MSLGPDLAPSTGPTVGGRALGVVMLLVTLTVCGLGVAKAATAAGYVGTRGTIEVEECRQSSGGRGHSDTRWCRGTFHAADSGARDVDAQVKSRDARPEDSVDVSRSGSEYVEVGHGHSWGFLVMAFLGLLLAAPAFAVAVSGISPRPAAHGAEAIRAALSGTWAARVVKWTALTSVAGMAVFGYLAWLF